MCGNINQNPVRCSTGFFFCPALTSEGGASTFLGEPPGNLGEPPPFLGERLSKKVKSLSYFGGALSYFGEPSPFLGEHPSKKVRELSF